MAVEVRPTTADDVARFLGRELPYRIRGVTGLIDGEIIAIGGIGYGPDETAIAFAHLTDAARKIPVTLHKTALRIIREARERGITTIVAQADASQPAAERWLRRLGFEPLEIEGETVWRNSR